MTANVGDAGQDVPQHGLLALDTSGRLWLHHGMERLLQVTIPPDTPITPQQVQYFPPAVPATVNGKLSVRTEPHSDFALKSETDDQEELAMRDLGRAVHVSHACGKTFLLHFAGGENVQLHIDVESYTELIGRCMRALQAIMDPPDYRTLLQEYYKCASVPWHLPFCSSPAHWLLADCVPIGEKCICVSGIGGGC